MALMNAMSIGFSVFHTSGAKETSSARERAAKTTSTITRRGAPEQPPAGGRVGGSRAEPARRRAPALGAPRARSAQAAQRTGDAPAASTTSADDQPRAVVRHDAERAAIQTSQ